MRPILSLLLSLLLSLPAHADGLRVVATFSLLADLCREIGGERVEVVSLVGPGGDAHAYQPSPADGRAIAHADLVVMNGLGFEGWIERLLRAGGYDGPQVVASEGASLIEAPGHTAGHDHHDHDGFADPHAWQDPANGRIYVRNIAEAFARSDPAGADSYRARAADYIGHIERLDAHFRERFAALPPERRRVVTSHDAFAYLGRAYGLEFIAPVGLSSAARPSAARVAALIRQLRDTGASALFVESVSDPRLMERIRSETHTRIGGTLYADTLSPPDGPAATYLQMMAFNLEAIAQALAP